VSPRRLISTGSPFETAYGYSRAVIDEPFAFVAGTTGYDYATMTMPEDVADQARNCWRTIGKVLDDAGFALDDIVRVTTYVTAFEGQTPTLEVQGEILGHVRPAATIVVVAGLARTEMKVEIEVTAKRRT
jgi:enamine deaminase RidA (YjgF/YER057c/UK114 family)